MERLTDTDRARLTELAHIRKLSLHHLIELRELVRLDRLDRIDRHQAMRDAVRSNLA